MASITDCVVEGLKYPFNDLKRLLTLGGVFAVISAISVFMSVKSFEIYTTIIHMIEKSSNVPMSPALLFKVPANDIYLVVGLAVITFIISLFILGYQYDIVKFSILKRDDLPEFNEIVGLFIRGIKYFLVVLAYNIIPIIVLLLGVTVAGYSFAPYAIVISAVLFMIAFFLQIMALNNMIAHDELKKAFDFREILDNIANLGWGKYIGILVFTLIIYMIIMVAVSFILIIITVAFAASISNQAFVISVVISVIEGLFVDSYGALFFNRVYGSVYRESVK